MTVQSHSWAYIQRKTWPEKTHAPQCSLQPCLQWPRHGNNINGHHQRNAQRKCGDIHIHTCVRARTHTHTHTQWNIAQSLTIMK